MPPATAREPWLRVKRSNRSGTNSGATPLPSVLDREPEVAVGLLGVHAHGRPPYRKAFVIRLVTMRSSALRSTIAIVSSGTSISTACGIGGRRRGRSPRPASGRRPARARSRSPPRRAARDRAAARRAPPCAASAGAAPFAHRCALLLVEPVGEMVQGRHEAVDRRHRRAQLVRGERDEVRLHLVRALEGDARLVLRLEEADAVEREAGERAERLQQRAAPRRRRTARTATSRRRCCFRRPPRRRRPSRPSRGGGSPRSRLAHARPGTFQAATTSPSALRIAIARAPTISAAGSSTRDATSSCDSAKREQARDRLLHARLLGRAPQDAQHQRRREAEQEGDDADHARGHASRARAPSLVRREQREQRARA